MSKFFLIPLILFSLCFYSCSDYSVQSKLINALTLSDSNPPVLLEVITESEESVRLVFNEEVQIFGSPDFNYFEDGTSILVTLSSSLEPGRSGTVSARVIDSAGNSSSFKVTVWGFNDNPASVLINEFTTRGSTDKVELKVLSSGSLAGYTIYAGTPVNYDSMFIFPDINVAKGDFVVLYWSEEYPGGPLPSISFLSGSNDNPTSNNGAIVLTKSPAQGSEVIDAVLYSSFESSQYGGWGTKSAYERASWVMKENWSGEAVNCSTSTATRSISRISGDTDTSSDWYITVTSGATFGAANTSEAYK